MPANPEQTPCSVMFSLLKEHGRIKHNELAALVLSGRPLPDGRSPVSRASDRSWVSRFVVHAPVGTLQQRYFTDYSTAALHITNRLRSRRGRPLTDEDIIRMLTGTDGCAMDRALAACGQNATLYRNALERLAQVKGHTDGERAEALMVLFVAAGCSANARAAVEYTMDCARVSYDMRTSTPTAALPTAADQTAGDASTAEEHPLGLIRVADGYIAGDPHWLDASGSEIGALAMGPHDIADVASDVSGHHARIRQVEGRWLVEDLGSRNGTVLRDAATGTKTRLTPGEPHELHPGDELHLAATTVLVAVEGAPGVV